MTNWTTIFIIIFLLIFMDKALTLTNLYLVKKNNPTLDPTTIEKNPMNRFLFQKLGFWGGTGVMILISLITFIFALWMLSFGTAIWSVDQKYNIALYILMMAYSFVIGNNFYFMFKFGGLL